MSPWVDLVGGAEAEIQLFSEYGHVAYQIKVNDTYNTMVAIISPFTHPQALWWGQGSKKIFF